MSKSNRFALFVTKSSLIFMNDRKKTTAVVCL